MISQTDRRQAWRWWSLRVSALGLLLSSVAASSPDALLTLWQSLPDDLHAIVPAAVTPWVTPVLFAATMIARLLPQREKASG